MAAPTSRQQGPSPTDVLARKLRMAPNVNTARWTMACSGLFAGLAGAAMQFWPPLATFRGWPVLCCALLVLASAAGWRARGRNTGVAVTAVLPLAAITLVVAVAHGGDPAISSILGLLPLFVVVNNLCAGFRAGLVTAAVSAAGLVLLATVEAPPHGASLTLGELIVQFALLALGVAIGKAATRLEARHREAADEREKRIAGLLAIAVDAYWEIDEELRLTAFESPRNADPLRAAAIMRLLGKVVWDLPQFRCATEVLDRFLADLEARAPVRDVRLQWESRSGKLRHFTLSGAPRFDAKGRFRGYWGVVRDTTRNNETAAALRATETRYQELFARIPTALVLHRAGIVMDANPAALQLFAFPDLSAMLGHNLVSNLEGGDSRERSLRRLEDIEHLPLGDALPVADFRMRTREGRAIAARATGVRVHAADGPATLSIFLDDTDRRRAELAVRRSEEMLRHLVATSPDVITLTDLSSGRYAMVNATFERVTGYAEAEVVGKTSIELGIWRDLAQRDAFVAQVRSHGTARDMSCDFIAKDGHVETLLVSGAVFDMDQRSYLVINGRDVSAQERDRLERAAIFENASIGIAVTRAQRFVHCNPRFANMFGWEPQVLANEHASVIWRNDASYADDVGPLLAKIRVGELVEFERQAHRRDGSPFYARVIAKAIDPSRPETSGSLWIVEDVTERHRVAAALAQAKDQAEAANRAKTAFLANTSHELRTPLNGMLGLAQMARIENLAPALRQQYLDQIVDNAHALAGIVTDVLDLSKIEAGKLTLAHDSFDLATLLGNLRVVYSAQCTGRDLLLRFEVDASAQCQVLGDALRLRQVLSNMLSNALKFTERGEISLSAKRLPSGMLHFEVSDTGPGLDEATQARIFKPFTQGDDSTTRRYGGTGLGLFICRELAQLMGGEVGVRSQLGQGATFWVTVPLPQTEPAPAEPVAAATQSLDGVRVLMVEDNAVNMLIGVSILERWGVVVTQALDGAQAVAAVEEAHAQGTPFQAVLMDVQMPVMSGYEATRALRLLPAGQGLPIIALTAAALVSEREEALAAGMDDFLTKPVDADKLKATLARWAAAGARA